MMAEARQVDAWDHTASTIAHLVTALSGRAYAPAEFHPFRRSELPSIAEQRPRGAL